MPIWRSARAHACLDRTGAFVLAAAGLLDGPRATTHWMYADLLAERFPQIDVDPRAVHDLARRGAMSPAR